MPIRFPILPGVLLGAIATAADNGPRLHQEP